MSIVLLLKASAGSIPNVLWHAARLVEGTGQSEEAGRAPDME